MSTRLTADELAAKISLTETTLAILTDLERVTEDGMQLMDLWVVRHPDGVHFVQTGHDSARVIMGPWATARIFATWDDALTAKARWNRENGRNADDLGAAVETRHINARYDYLNMLHEMITKQEDELHELKNLSHQMDRLARAVDMHRMTWLSQS